MFSNIPEELRLLPLSLLNSSGIYMILNTINGKYYIGSAKNFRERWNKHTNELDFNRHHSRHLQFAWNRGDVFQFIIIELIQDRFQLDKVEQIWIDSSDCCNPNIGYNTSPTATTPLGIKRSLETKAKMSAAWKNRKPISEETRLKMSLAKKGKRLSEACRKANRNFKDWPHKLGSKCRCDECKAKINKAAREYYANGK